jgi:glycine cleavage system H protein
MPEPMWQGCVVPDDRLYDVDLHVWVLLEDGPTGRTARIGMTDVAQSLAGRVVQLSWKRPGRILRRGQTGAVVESAKWVGPFPTPLTGQLVEANPGFDADPALANKDPYGAGWMARVRPTDLDAEGAHLREPAAAYQHYRRYIDEHGITCYRCADS